MVDTQIHIREAAVISTTKVVVAVADIFATFHSRLSEEIFCLKEMFLVEVLVEVVAKSVQMDSNVVAMEHGQQ